jgi:hypothetical protein
MNELKNKVYHLNASALKKELNDNPQWLKEYSKTSLSDCLVLAISEQKNDSLKALLEYGIQAQDFSDGKSLLGYCLEEYNLEAFYLLVKFGFDCMKQKVLDTVLHGTYVELISFFIQNGAQEKGLSFSPHYPNQEVIFELLNHGISTQEIGKNFILSFEIDDFNESVVLWEKQQLEKKLDAVEIKNNKMKI